MRVNVRHRRYHGAREALVACGRRAPLDTLDAAVVGNDERDAALPTVGQQGKGRVEWFHRSYMGSETTFPTVSNRQCVGATFPFVSNDLQARAKVVSDPSPIVIRAAADAA
jgi:hypothetical protein